MDENEVKSIASHWIRRVEANVLSKVYDNTEPTEGQSIVTNRFRHDSLDSSVPKPSPKEKIHTDTTSISSSATNFNYQENNKLAKSTSENLHDLNPRTRTHSSRNSPRSPRVNLEILRRKRLEHFENRDWISKENLVNYIDEVPNSSHTSVLERDTSDEFLFKNSENLNFKSPDGFNTQRSDEDDKLRLELWGLRGAVESGQIDIKSYICPSRFSHFSQNTSQSVEASLQPLTNQSLSYQETCIKASSSRDYNHNLTSYSNKSEDLPVLNSSVDNLPQLAMLSIETPHHGRSCRNHVFPKEDFTHFTVSRDPPFSLFGCPAPQIEGNLYNGFETSDSESSVNTTVLCSNSAAKNDTGLKSNEIDKPLKSGRGKQKILTELTEFLGAERNSKKTNAEKEKRHSATKYQHATSKMHFPNQLLEPNSSAVDLLLKTSSTNLVSENGIRSRSTSPEEHNESGSTSEAAQNNRNFQFTKQNDVDKSDHFYTDPEEGSKKHPCHKSNPTFGKVCPTCKEVNSQAANWCIECGTALISIEATILDQMQFSQYQRQHQETKKLISEALQSRKEEGSYFSTAKKKERELKEDVINLSKEVQKNSDFSKDSLQSNVTSYKRRWLKSSLAWSTFEPQELSKPPSVLKGSEKKEVRQHKERIIDSALRSRSSSDLAVIEKCKKKNKSKNGLKSSRRQRSSSATYHSADDYDTINLSINLEQTNQKSPRGSKPTNHCRPTSAKQSKVKKPSNRPGSARSQHRSPSPLSLEETTTPSPSKKSPCNSVSIPQLNLDDVGSYDRILTLIRSQRDSDPVPYLYLPDEILLEIFSSLSNKDLLACACVCSQFYRIAMDETLWRTIVIRKNRDICDAWLESIGDKHPSSLTISQCSSSKVSSEGLRRLFRKCSESLEEVDFSGCSGGELIGESILLHISVRCFNVTSIDVSWTNVSDNGVQELAKNLKRIDCLCLNGCQAITDKSLTAVSKRHGKSLRIFEVFGCFNITPAGLLLFGSQCLRLHTLNIGQCHKMTDAAVGNLVSHLPEIENLDLRGCKQTRDSAVKKIVRHCPHLQSLVLANCPLITDSTLSEISTNLSGIRSLDICGCSYITDAGIRALARCCHKLELLDLSSTGTTVTSKSIVALSNYCSQSLRVLKLSFCSDISVNTVNQVVKNCKKLTLLHLYGCKRIKELDKIKNIRPNLVIER